MTDISDNKHQSPDITACLLFIIKCHLYLVNLAITNSLLFITKYHFYLVNLDIINGILFIQKCHA